MAVEVESRTIAFCQFFGVGQNGVPVNPATLRWKGQGIDSVTRAGAGSYIFALEENLDPNDVIHWLPGQGEILATTLQTNQVTVTGANTIQVETFQVLGVAAVDVFMGSLQVLRFNVEAPIQAVS